MSEDKKYTIPRRFTPVRPEPKYDVKTFPELESTGVEAYYIEDFFTESEADAYLETLFTDYPFHQEQVSVMGKTFDQPRLTRLMGDEGKNYYYSGYSRKAVGWISSVKEIRDRIMKLILTIRADHSLLTTVLGNLYMNGHNYIGPHSDDETDLSSNAMIASVSFGSERDFDIFDKKTKERILRVNLKHGSLFLMGAQFQKKLKHGVPKRLRIKDPRINLTFRVIDADDLP